MENQSELKAKVWPTIPYIYFIGLATFWFLGEIFANQSPSYVALGMIMFLIIQAVIRVNVFGIVLGILAILLSAYSFLAVLSEFNEFKFISYGAIQLITVGSVLSLIGLGMGFVMVIGSAKRLT